VRDADKPFVPGREEGWRLVVGDDERGRLEGTTVSFDDLDLLVQHTGTRSELVTRSGTPVLRFDPGGRKATTLTLSTSRFRLARQRPRPFLHRWRLTSGVHGGEVLTVSTTPFGTRLRVADDTDVPVGDLAVLAMAALIDVLGVEPAAAAA
jgi:hypothetical protein